MKYHTLTVTFCINQAIYSSLAACFEWRWTRYTDETLWVVPECSSRKSRIYNEDPTDGWSYIQ